VFGPKNEKESRDGSAYHGESEASAEAVVPTTQYHASLEHASRTASASEASREANRQKSLKTTTRER